jgi:hypothetical protein
MKKVAICLHEYQRSEKETFVDILSYFSHNLLFNIARSFHANNEIIIVKIVEFAKTEYYFIW